MRTAELAERLGVSPGFVRYHFRRWCQKSGKSPEDFKKTEEYRRGGVTMVVGVFDIPEEAVKYIEEKAKERRRKLEEHRKNAEELFKNTERHDESNEISHDMEIYKARVGVQYGATPLVVYSYLTHEELKELLELAEKHGYRLILSSDESIVIHVEEVKE